MEKKELKRLKFKNQSFQPIEWPSSAAETDWGYDSRENVEELADDFLTVPLYHGDAEAFLSLLSSHFIYFSWFDIISFSELCTDQMM